MKKTVILAMGLAVLFAPMCYADAACDAAGSENYLKSTAGKLYRGIGNAALSWVEVFRQPMINENKWEGVGKGIVQTGVRAVLGALDVATAIFPGVNVPLPDPPCPRDLVNTESSSPASA